MLNTQHVHENTPIDVEAVAGVLARYLGPDDHRLHRLLDLDCVAPRHSTCGLAGGPVGPVGRV